MNARVVLALVVIAAAAFLAWRLFDEDDAPRRERERPETEAPAPKEPVPDESAPGARPAKWTVRGTVKPPTATVRVYLGRRLLGEAPVKDGRFARDLLELEALSAERLHVARIVVRAEAAGHVPAKSEARELDDLAFALELTAGAFVTGTVRDVSGRPVEDADVWFSPKPETWVATDAEGRYWLPVEQAGTRWVCARKGDRGAAMHGPLDFAGSGANVDLVLTGPGRLTGVAVHPDGKPAAHLQLHAAPEALHGKKISSWPGPPFDGSKPRPAGLAWGWTRTDAEGRFTIEGLQAGRYFFKQDKARKLFPTGSDVRLVIPGYRLRIYVRDEQGEPVLGYTVAARSDGSAMMAGNTDAPHAIMSTFVTPGATWTATLGGREIEPVHEVVKIREGKHDYVAVLTPKVARRRGRLAIKLTGPDGRPLEAGRTTLYAPGRNLVLYERTLEAGTTPLVPAGPYRVIVTGGADPFALFLPAEGEAEVRADTITPVALQCRAGGRIRFTFTGEVGWVRVMAKPQHGGEAVNVGVALRRLKKGWRTGGGFKAGEPTLSWRVLAPGPYVLEFSGQHRAESRPVLIRPGEVTDITVELEKTK